MPKATEVKHRHLPRWTGQVEESKHRKSAQHATSPPPPQRDQVRGWTRHEKILRQGADTASPVILPLPKRQAPSLEDQREDAKLELDRLEDLAQRLCTNNPLPTPEHLTFLDPPTVASPDAAVTAGVNLTLADNVKENAWVREHRFSLSSLLAQLYHCDTFQSADLGERVTSVSHMVHERREALDRIIEQEWQIQRRRADLVAEQLEDDCPIVYTGAQLYSAIWWV